MKYSKIFLLGSVNPEMVSVLICNSFRFISVDIGVLIGLNHVGKYNILFLLRIWLHKNYPLSYLLKQCQPESELTLEITFAPSAHQENGHLWLLKFITMQQFQY